MTAYGTSAEILGEAGIFSAIRGVSQGDSASTMKWDCFQITLSDLQMTHVHEGVVEVLGAGLRRAHCSPPRNSNC